MKQFIRYCEITFDRYWERKFKKRQKKLKHDKISFILLILLCLILPIYFAFDTVMLLPGAVITEGVVVAYEPDYELETSKNWTTSRQWIDYYEVKAKAGTFKVDLNSKNVRPGKRILFLYHPDDKEKTHIIYETLGRLTVFLDLSFILAVLCWLLVVPFLYLNVKSIDKILKKYPDLDNVPGVVSDDDDSQGHYKSVMDNFALICILLLAVVVVGVTVVARIME